jgi:hypothetical protein
MVLSGSLATYSERDPWTRVTDACAVGRFLDAELADGGAGDWRWSVQIPHSARMLVETDEGDG